MALSILAIFLAGMTWMQISERRRALAVEGKGIPAGTAGDARSATGEFNRLLHERGSITFRSWNGVAYRMDADTEMTFLPGGKAHMFEYGYALSRYHGTYRIDRQGTITASFPTFKHQWPVMLLRWDSTSLLLEPKATGDGLVMGNRGAATIREGQGSYWPFRPVSPKDEIEIRREIK